MKFSRHLSASCGAMALLCTALLFSTCYSSPLPSSSDSGIVKRESTRCVQQPRALCSHTRGRPEFFHHCIEAMFPCGESGFTLSYAAKKFGKLHQEELKHIGQALTDYLDFSELCFQTQLERIALDMSTTRLVNSESCLAFETRAINALNNCYQDQSLCHLLSNTQEGDTLHGHLHSVVDAFRVGGSYFNNTVVDMGIPEAVRKCSGQSELADSLTSTKLPVKVTWCALSRNYSSSPNGRLTDAQLVEDLSGRLNRPVDQFVFSGPDVEGQCDSINPVSEYFLITWFASPEDPKLSSITVISDRTFSIYVLYHEVNGQERESSQCGDGVRQAGEFCDFSGNLDGCDLTCNVRTGYTCSTSRLTASECTLQSQEEMEQEMQRPVICETTSRQSQSMSRSRIQTISSSSVQDPIKSDAVFNAQLAGSSSAISAGTMNLPLLVLIAAFCLWVPRW